MCMDFFKAGDKQITSLQNACFGEQSRSKNIHLLYDIPYYNYFPDERRAVYLKKVVKTKAIKNIQLK